MHITIGKEKRARAVIRGKAGFEHIAECFPTMQRARLQSPILPKIIVIFDNSFDWHPDVNKTID